MQSRFTVPTGQHPHPCDGRGHFIPPSPMLSVELGSGQWVGGIVVLAGVLFPGCLLLSHKDYKSHNAIHPAEFLIGHTQENWCLVMELCFLGYVVPTLPSLSLALDEEILSFDLSLAQRQGCG